MTLTVKVIVPLQTISFEYLMQIKKKNTSSNNNEITLMKTKKNNKGIKKEKEKEIIRR